jgi:hypothetical protein
MIQRMGEVQQKGGCAVHADHCERIHTRHPVSLRNDRPVPALRWRKLENLINLGLGAVQGQHCPNPTIGPTWPPRPSGLMDWFQMGSSPLAPTSLGSKPPHHRWVRAIEHLSWVRVTRAVLGRRALCHHRHCLAQVRWALDEPPPRLVAQSGQRWVPLVQGTPMPPQLG